MRVRAGQTSEEKKDNFQSRTYQNGTADNCSGAKCRVSKSTASTPAEQQLWIFISVRVTDIFTTYNHRKLGYPQRGLNLQ